MHGDTHYTLTAITRSLHLLSIAPTTSSFAKAGCFACTNNRRPNSLPCAARAKGIPVDEKAMNANVFLQITSTINPVALEGAAALGGAG